MKERLKARLPLMVTVIGIGILLDQLTKLWAVNSLRGGPRYSFLFDSIKIYYIENHGAFLGLGNTLSPQMRFWIFTGMVGLFLLALLIYILVAKQMDKLSLFSLSLVFTGGFSNFIDRAFNQGAVVDFLNMGLGRLRTGVFNVADVYIMIGAACIVFGQWWLEHKKKQQ